MCNGISDTNFTSVALYLNSDNCNISVHENEFGLIAKILIMEVFFHHKNKFVFYQNHFAGENGLERIVFSSFLWLSLSG